MKPDYTTAQVIARLREIQKQVPCQKHTVIPWRIARKAGEFYAALIDVQDFSPVIVPILGDITGYVMALCNAEGVDIVNAIDDAGYNNTFLHPTTPPELQGEDISASDLMKYVGYLSEAVDSAEDTRTSALSMTAGEFIGRVVFNLCARLGNRSLWEVVSASAEEPAEHPTLL